MNRIHVGVRNCAVSLRHGGRPGETLRRNHSELEVELIAVRDDGTAPTGEPQVFGQGGSAARALIRELEHGSIDAVWTDMRDLPWPLPRDVTLAACAQRRNPREAFLHRQGRLFADLPDTSRLATTNLLSKMQISSVKPNFAWAELSGDLPTRLHKLHLQQADGVIESASDLLILGFDEKTIEFMPMDRVLPPPGQGIWALCCLRERKDVRLLARQLEDDKSRLCGTVERDFSTELSGGGVLPVAAWARIQRDRLLIDGAVPSPAGSGMMRLSIGGPPGHSGKLVDALATMFRGQGVKGI